MAVSWIWNIHQKGVKILRTEKLVCGKGNLKVNLFQYPLSINNVMPSYGIKKRTLTSNQRHECKQKHFLCLVGWVIFWRLMFYYCRVFEMIDFKC